MKIKSQNTLFFSFIQYARWNFVNFGLWKVNFWMKNEYNENRRFGFEFTTKIMSRDSIWHRTCQFRLAIECLLTTVVRKGLHPNSKFRFETYTKNCHWNMWIPIFISSSDFSITKDIYGKTECKGEKRPTDSESAWKIYFEELICFLGHYSFMNFLLQQEFAWHTAPMGGNLSQPVGATFRTF